MPRAQFVSADAYPWGQDPVYCGSWHNSCWRLLCAMPQACLHVMPLRWVASHPQPSQIFHEKCAECRGEISNKAASKNQDRGTVLVHTSSQPGSWASADVRASGCQPVTAYLVARTRASPDKQAKQGKHARTAHPCAQS